MSVEVFLVFFQEFLPKEVLHDQQMTCPVPHKLLCRMLQGAESEKLAQDVLREHVAQTGKLTGIIAVEEQKDTLTIDEKF